MFIAVLFTITPNWKQSIVHKREEINYGISPAEYYKIKKNKLLIYPITRMNLTNMMSKRSQRRGCISYMIPFI